MTSRKECFLHTRTHSIYDSTLRPTPAQARQNSSRERGGRHEILLLVKEPLAIDSYQGRESQFSLWYNPGQVGRPHSKEGHSQEYLGKPKVELISSNQEEKSKVVGQKRESMIQWIWEELQVGEFNQNIFVKRSRIKINAAIGRQTQADLYEILLTQFQAGHPRLR